MKKVLILAAMAVASAAWAQAPAQKQEAAGSQEAAESQASNAQAAKPQAAKPAQMARKSRRMQDARHCLERASNPEVIKCAEEYL